MFPAGNTSASFTVTISNDNVLERPETFRLVINQTSEPSLVIATTPDQATVFIRDDDRKFF